MREDAKNRKPTINAKERVKAGEPDAPTVRLEFPVTRASSKVANGQEFQVTLRELAEDALMELLATFLYAHKGEAKDILGMVIDPGTLFQGIMTLLAKYGKPKWERFLPQTLHMLACVGHQMSEPQQFLDKDGQISPSPIGILKDSERLSEQDVVLWLESRTSKLHRRWSTSTDL